MIKITKPYSWYNVYINNTLILTHLTQKDINEILQQLHQTNTPYSMDLRGN